jgi:transcriptional regulator with XRE-family HTH domain
VPRGPAWDATHLAESDRADPAAFEQAKQASGRSYQALADQLEMPRSTLYTIGQGKTIVSTEFARRLEEALGVSPGTVFPSLRPTSPLGG